MDYLANNNADQSSDVLQNLYNMGAQVDYFIDDLLVSTINRDHSHL